ncbi:hypothetical protein Q0O45_13235, partial [Staphylococcus aureus]|nr:hypothetical protein [Staphylococcus aureus]
LDNQQRVNIQKTMFSSSRTFNNDIHYFVLEKNKNFDWEAYSHEKEKLRNEIKSLTKASKDIAIASQELIASRDLNVDDFAGGKTNSIAV